MYTAKEIYLSIAISFTTKNSLQKYVEDCIWI